MNKEEFLKQLEELLTGISEEEKADALSFYRSYFEDAGVENEAAVLEKLESPQKVAESIRTNLGLERNSSWYDEAMFQKRDVEKEKKHGWSAAVIVLLILSSPVWLTLILAAAAVLLGAAAAVFGVVISVIAVMAAFVIAGCVVFGCGVSFLFTGGAAVIGIELLGFGCLLLAAGILEVLLVVCLLRVILPWAVRGISELVRRIFAKKKKSGVAA